ncbi:MAG TPA: hypothetical protein PKE06_19625 [Flavilitoribacter sp.]|nr:hypothetical protein [Flavilitoribacter sp.]
MRTLSFFLLLTLFSLAACNNSAPSEQTEETPPAQKYTVTPFTSSTEFADAAIESMEYKDGKFAFGIGGSTYQLGVQTPDADAKMCANSAKGQHIHLIIDNAPYAAEYTREFEYDIPDGEHYLLAFLSRSYHESIKTKAASKVEKISVANKSFTATSDLMDPMLFYSRPKGEYIGKKETDKVMLDFYLANCTLGTDYKVKAEINGEEHMIDKWQPYYIEGLPIGDNTIKLTLVDKDGNMVNTPLNPVERTFTLKADPTEQ